MRGEATENSDIDIMAVIDDMTISDLDIYRAAIHAIGDEEKSCGFIVGRVELENWNPLECCHVLHCTQDYYGCLKVLLPAFADEDIRNYVKVSVNNLYHEICHRYIHGTAKKNEEKIVYSYKSVFFILQNLHYLDSGVFAVTKRELLERLSGKDRLVLETAIHLSAGGEYDFREVFRLLLGWCQETMTRVRAVIARFRRMKFKEKRR